MQISNVLPTDDVLDSMSRLAAAAVTTNRPTDMGTGQTGMSWNWSWGWGGLTNPFAFNVFQIAHS